MKKIAIAIHGGAGEDSAFIREHLAEYEEGLKAALDAGYKVLRAGGTAVEAVEAAVRSMEDNSYFNAGRGSALNAEGEVEMCTSVMEGKEKRAGAAALVKNVKNPISFAKSLMESSEGMYVGGPVTVEMAREIGLELEPDSYFITEHQFDAFAEERQKHPGKDNSRDPKNFKKHMHGTVGAVAVDKKGNVAAGTSTGGTSFCLPGRIGDSSMIGVGSYADNQTAAISCTGDGEYLIREVMAGSISATIEHTQCTVQEACDHVIHVKNKDTKADLGAIAVDKEGNIGITFNSERMHRGWKTSDDEFEVAIYR